MTQEEKKWRKEKDAYEQLHAVLNWCDYEDYDYLYKCGSMETLIQLYLFVNFEIGVEFVSGVQDLIDEEEEDGIIDTIAKAYAWDKEHGTHFWHSNLDEEDVEREVIRHELSALVMDTTEQDPLVCDITIGEHDAQGLSTLELPRVVSVFQDPEAKVWFNLLGYKEPMEFDEMTTADLRTIHAELTENN